MRDQKKQNAAQRKYRKTLKGKQKIRAWNIKRTNELKRWANQFKSDGCVACGEKDLRCLDFHYRKDKYEKESNICKMIQECKTKQKILVEVNKCVILCANCHRKMHAGGGLEWK